MNKDFSDQVSTYNKDKFHIQAPGEQFWDGLSAEEKKNKTLVVVKTHKTESGKEEYDKFIINKVDNKGLPISGIKFCIVAGATYKGCNEKYNTWKTDEDGKVEIPVNELPLYTTYLYETSPIGKVKDEENSNTYKPKTISLYVDPGDRFLGEVEGKKFITYDELIARINGVTNPKSKKYQVGEETKIGKVLSKGNDSSTGGNWLKIYDARAGKTLYIAKKPLTNGVSWNELCFAGVVFGLDQVNADGTLKPHFKTPPNCRGTYKPKIVTITDGKETERKYIVRLLRGTSRPDPNNTDLEEWEYTDKEDLTKSEWNRYILPITKYYRYGYYSYYKRKNYIRDETYTRYVGNELAKDKDENYFKPPKNDYKDTAYTPEKGWRINLASYNWFMDLTSGTLVEYKYKGETYGSVDDIGQYSWMQDYLSNGVYRASRGYDNTYYGAAMAISLNTNRCDDSIGFRPVLEEIY